MSDISEVALGQAAHSADNPYRQRHFPLTNRTAAGTPFESNASVPGPPHHDADLTPSIALMFSEVPTDLAQLEPLALHSQQIENNAPSSEQPPSLPQGKSSNHQPRKPSPGLAARLKALGFSSGSARQSSPPPPSSNHPDSIGRLPEDQLRLLDQNHQAGSTGLIVERRGRPWKGATAPLQLLKSKPSLKFKGDQGQNKSSTETDVPAPRTEYLPEISGTAALDMDTNKYRLPDHTNGNGTKAQLDTRREHIERDATAPPSEPQTPPPPSQPTTPANFNASEEYDPSATSYFNPLGLQRPGSIYTISRASFANQLAQLTSLQLPDADSLSSKVSAIPTAQLAAKALINAAEQIRSWISKASEVIGGLDSDDDVEWAAAGGREGYEEVENAIIRFEELINVYVSAIEELQTRRDITNVSSDDLNRAVTQMESILEEWAKIRSTLNSAKGQVETAMEWEELWDLVLGDIQSEMEELGRLVFEMEERRHKSLMAVASGDNVDIGDLETIVEETPAAAVRNNRFSLPAFPMSPSSPGTPSLTQDDSSLLALFARMQPLRASLDFLPMRLSVFQARAERAFPTACEELEMRRAGLEATYKKLEKDAESLRKELGEDKWVIVFRGAGRQALKMTESVERSIAKLRESVDAGMHLTNQAVLSKKIESYEAKKTHYGPAIERVLSIIDKGVKDRLTVNGEILRLHAETQSKWDTVKGQMADMDISLEEIQADNKGQQLRDSVSSMLSNDRSTIGSGAETPGSSPPSSVIMSSIGLEPITPSLKKTKSRSGSVGSHLPQPSSSARRNASGLAPGSQGTRRPLGSRLSTLSSSPSGLSTPSRSSSITPAATRLPRSTPDNRPKWNMSTNTTDSDLGHNFKPLSLTTPSPYARRTPTTVRSTSSLTPGSRESRLPMRSPLGRESSASPILENTPSRPSLSRLAFRDRVSSPGPYAQQSLSKPRLSTQASMSALTNRRVSLQPPRPEGGLSDAKPRPASSLATSRRVSLLPHPTPVKENEAGRLSPQAVAGARSAVARANAAADANKPRWRF